MNPGEFLKSFQCFPLWFDLPGRHNQHNPGWIASHRCGVAKEKREKSLAGRGDRAVPNQKSPGVKHSLSTFTERGTWRHPPGTISEPWDCSAWKIPLKSSNHQIQHEPSTVFTTSHVPRCHIHVGFGHLLKFKFFEIFKN